MKQKRQQNPRDWHERRLEADRYQDRPRLTDEAARKVARRTKRPGEVGLANEQRPGLGTRAKKTSQTKPAKKTSARKPAKSKRKRTGTAHDREPLGRVAPLPPDKPDKQQEEQSDTFAREQERDTGVSGHMSGD